MSQNLSTWLPVVLSFLVFDRLLFSVLAHVLPAGSKWQVRAARWGAYFGKLEALLPQAAPPKDGAS